jgi:hypothetical protein
MSDKPSPRKDVKVFLNKTKDLHDGHDFDDLVEMLLKGIDKGAIAKQFGDVARQTVWNWFGDIKNQYSDIYEQITAVTK